MPNLTALLKYERPSNSAHEDAYINDEVRKLLRVSRSNERKRTLAEVEAWIDAAPQTRELMWLSEYIQQIKGR